jgi:hypothetical protein
MKTLVLLLLVAPVLLQVSQSLLRIVCCLIKKKLGKLGRNRCAKSHLTGHPRISATKRLKELSPEMDFASDDMYVYG